MGFAPTRVFMPSAEQAASQYLRIAPESLEVRAGECAGGRGVRMCRACGRMGVCERCKGKMDTAELGIFLHTFSSVKGVTYQPCIF